jgi:TolB-like protein/DNA-binding SARP family transcriptional activator/lipoprotein NlpI
MEEAKITIQIKLFGRFELRSEAGEEITIPTRKGQALLAMLALAGGEPVPRERLMALLWSDRGEQQARSSLRQTLTEVRKALARVQPPILVAKRDTVQIDPNVVAVDVVAFENLIDENTPSALESAAKLYGGDLLDGVSVHDPAYEDWVRGERQRLHTSACKALFQLLEHQALGDTERAISTARRLLTLDPLQEAVHRKLMRLYSDQGNRTSALKQFQACQEVLRMELGIETEPETNKLAEEVRIGAAAAPDLLLLGAKPLKLPDKPSIAVLPFVNMSGDPEQQYFCDGISEDVITELSRFGALEVVARHSTFVFRDQAVDWRQAAKVLGVRYLLEGSLRKSGNRIRLTAQLLDVETGKHAWAERYDRELEDIFAIQDELVHAIVATLAGRLETADTERSLRKPPESLVAYDYYLRALQFDRRYDAESVLEGRKVLEKAVALDPTFAKAHALLAIFVVYSGWFESGDQHAHDDEALVIARKAIELDPDDGYCYSKLAIVHLHRGEFKQAQHSFQKALDLNPNDLWIWSHYAWYLSRIGEHQKALDRLDQREALEPYPPNWHAEIRGQALYGLGRFSEAVDSFHRMTVTNPWNHAFLAACYGQLGETDKAKKHLEAYRRAVPGASLRTFGDNEMYFQHPEDLELWLGGLRKAGLTE